MNAEVKPLAITPGGSIRQHIERDTNNPRIWGVGSSKILTVQLIDSRTFALVTGLDPPETPMTPDIYRELRLPFYQLPWVEYQLSGVKEGGDGVEGQWGHLKGAKAVAAANVKAALKSPTKGKGKTIDSLPEVEICGSVSGGAGAWGVLKSGMWGKLESETGRTSLEEEESEEDFQDASFEFPLKLLDVDESIPEFQSAVEKDRGGDGDDDEWVDEEWADEAGFFPS